MDHVLNLLTDRRQILAGQKCYFCWILTGENLMRQNSAHQILMRRILMCQILTPQILTGERQLIREAF